MSSVRSKIEVGPLFLAVTVMGAGGGRYSSGFDFCGEIGGSISISELDRVCRISARLAGRSCLCNGDLISNGLTGVGCRAGGDIGLGSGEECRSETRDFGRCKGDSEVTTGGVEDLSSSVTGVFDFWGDAGGIGVTDLRGD